MALAVHSQESSLGERLRDGRDELAELRAEASGIASGLGQVARDEALLAVAEVRDGVQASIRTGIWGGIALAMAALTLLWLPLPIVLALAEAMPMWAAALVTVALLAVLAAVVGLVAYRHFKSITLVPREAMGRIKEDTQWVKQQLSGKPN